MIVEAVDLEAPSGGDGATLSERRRWVVVTTTAVIGAWSICPGVVSRYRGGGDGNVQWWYVVIVEGVRERERGFSETTRSPRISGVGSFRF